MTTITCPICGDQVQLVANGICPSCLTSVKEPAGSPPERPPIVATPAPPGDIGPANPFAATGTGSAPREPIDPNKRTFGDMAAPLSLLLPLSLCGLGSLMTYVLIPGGHLQGATPLVLGLLVWGIILGGLGLGISGLVSGIRRRRVGTIIYATFGLVLTTFFLIATIIQVFVALYGG